MSSAPAVISSTKPKTIWYFFLMALASVIWSAQGIAIKFLDPHLGPIAITFLPFYVTTLLFVPLLLRMRKQNPNAVNPSKQDWVKFVIAGVGGQVLAQLGMTWGISKSLASNGAILNLLIPVISAVLASLMLKERLTLLRAASLAIGLLGVAFLSVGDFRQASFGSMKFLMGNLLIFGGCFGSSFYNVYCKGLMQRFQEIEILIYSYITASVFSIPLLIWAEPFHIRSLLDLDGKGIAAFLFLAFFMYGASMLLFFKALQHLDVTTASMSLYLVPVFGVLLAALLLGERLSITALVGAAIVLISTILVVRYDEATKLGILLIAYLALATAVAAQQPFPVISTVDESSIAGRPVALDSQGKLLPWPMPDDTGYSYSSYFLSQWTIVWDQYNRQRLPYYYCCFEFDRRTFEMMPDEHWANSTGYLRAMMQGFLERLYPYTGDPHTLEFLQNLVDYELEHGLTPEGYAWAQVPYPSANPGSTRYTGWSEHGEDYVEPHVVGEDGYAYLRLYEMTGNTKYLRAAIRCAEALAKNFKPGDDKNSPWPYRCFARDGRMDAGTGMFPYSANVVEPIMLLDELIRLDQGEVATYKKVREGAWAWLMKYPMQNNVWVGYFEDVKASMENMNQVIPLELARYVLLHPEKDADWREHSKNLIHWVKTTPKWPKYLVHGATVTTEQGDGKEFCCNIPNQCCDSHSSRLAAVEALYYAKTGDVSYKEAAYRTYNWVTYFQGLSAKAHAPFSEQWWFTDEFSDGPRRMMDAFWAIPEWAPADESHLLGSLSPVTKIAYGTGSVTYSTFDQESTDVLRLNFVPDFVTVGGKSINRRQDLAQQGYTFDDATHVLTIRHSGSREVDLQGKSNVVPPSYVTFDDPHLLARTPLVGQYPSGVIDWGDGNWQVDTPRGKFATFTLSLVDTGERHAGFRFYSPRIFAGVDVYNDGDTEATVVVSSPEIREKIFTIKPKELRRLRTGWRDPSSQVNFDFTNAQGLLFDNLAYQHP